ncbi:MAG: TolC family protein, partial [Moraxellaceae bacterium]|nr:TolC family protein [Moraxellaceae bacterium]
MSCARMTRSKCALVAVVMVMGLPTLSHAMSMTEALLLAEKVDPAVNGSLALLDAERELGKQERATRLPQVNAVAGIRETDAKVTATPFGAGFNERYQSWDASVELRQPLFRFDFFARGRRANALDELAEAGGIVREQVLIYRVAERYLGVLQAKSALRLAQSEADAVSRSLGDTQKRYDVQLIPGTDLKEAQARNDLAQANLIAAQQQLDTAQDLLDESTGQGYADLPDFPANATLPALDDDSREVWLQRVMTENPNLRAARANVQVAKANADSRMSSAMPEIDVVASHGRQDSSDSMIGSAGNNSVVGLELRVPIFASGGNRSRVKEADARRRVAEGELDSAIRSTQRETRR